MPRVATALLAVSRPTGFLLAVLLLATPLPATAPPNPAAAFDRAAELYTAGHPREALAEFRRLARAAQASDPELAGAAQSNVCALEGDLGDFRAARASCEEGLRRCRALGDAECEAQVLNNLGRAQEALGETAGAERSYRAALALQRKLGDAEAEVMVLGNLGTVALSTGRFSQALDLYAAAERLAGREAAQPWAVEQLRIARINRGVALERVGARREALDLYRGLLAPDVPLDPHRRAALLVSSGVIYRNLGDPVHAEASFRQAIDLFRRQGDEAGLSNAYLNLGLALHLNLGRPAEAEQAYREALRRSQASGDRTEEVLDLFYLGRLLAEGHRLAEARASFERCLAVAKASDSAEGRWSALEGLGQVAEAERDPDVALASYEASLTEIERVRAGIASGERRAGYFGDKRAVYAATVALLARLDAQRPGKGFAARALTQVQRAKARDLLDLLRLPGERARPLRTSEIQARVGEGVLLEYFFTSERLLLWLVRRDGVRLFDLGLKEPVVAAVGAIHRDLAHGREPERETVRRLSQILLAPAEPLPQGGRPFRSLRIAGDGLLRYLPFELLDDPADPERRLIERIAVTYLPSASTLGEGEERGPKAGDLRFAGFGAPDLAAGGTATLAGLLVQRFHLAPLPGAGRELKAVQRILLDGGAGGIVRTGAQATEAALRQALARHPQVVHFATHAVLDERQLRGAAILLSPGPSPGGEDDGLLEPAEIAVLRDPASLTVLAACKTALGPEDEGRALTSLTGSFLAAGSKGVLATLWDVGDANTAAFMEQFYGQLARGERPAEALRKAKLKMLGDPRWTQPALWAGYVLVGDAPPVAPGREWWIWGAVGVLGLALGVMLWSGRNTQKLVK